MARVDYDKQAMVYDEGRGLSPQATQLWMVHAQRHVPEATRILDLGSGTGRFSAALADAYDATVVAVEPSDGMRRQAAGKAHDRVHVVAGTAEAIPLFDDTCDFAWLSNVTHHFDDLTAAAHELRRVADTVLVRGSFAGREHPSLFRFFPAAQAIVDSMPSVTETLGAFEAAGFTSLYNEVVSFKLADSLADMVPRIRMRADTTLELISDEEFELGLELLVKTARVEHDPVLDSLDLLVLR